MNHHFLSEPCRFEKNALFPGSVIGLINWLAVWWTVMVGKGGGGVIATSQIHRSYGEVRACICKRLGSPGIDSKESIPPAYVAWRAGAVSNRTVVPERLAGNWFLDSLKGLKIRALGNLYTHQTAGSSHLPGRIFFYLTGYLKNILHATHPDTILVSMIQYTRRQGHKINFFFRKEGKKS